MNKFLRYFPLLFCAIALVACTAAEERGPVVLAAASLHEAVEEVADLWEEKGHARPVLSFAGTSSLARQAEGGAPADIFFSADAEWMDWLEERELIETSTRRDILSNNLVWVAHDQSDAVLSFEDRTELLQQERLAIADPDAVPAGRYAKAALERLGLWEKLRDRIVPAENVRAALALVENGEARFGIVYATDALASDRVFVAGSILSGDGATIVYPAALLAGSNHPDAEALLDYLSGAEAGEVFRRHGFIVSALCPPC